MLILKSGVIRSGKMRICSVISLIVRLRLRCVGLLKVLVCGVSVIRDGCVYFKVCVLNGWCR